MSGVTARNGENGGLVIQFSFRFFPQPPESTNQNNYQGSPQRGLMSDALDPHALQCLLVLTMAMFFCFTTLRLNRGDCYKQPISIAVVALHSRARNDDLMPLVAWHNLKLRRRHAASMRCRCVGSSSRYCAGQSLRINERASKVTLNGKTYDAVLTANFRPRAINLLSLNWMSLLQPEINLLHPLLPHNLHN